MVIVVASGCNFSEPAQRVEVDPRLSDVVGDAGGGDAVSVDTGAASDATGDSTGALVRSVFTCEPTCASDRYCGPDGVCYALSGSCVSPGEVCDPRVTERTPEFVCEPVFGADAGVCRRICTSENAQSVCGGGESCVRLVEDNALTICRLSCEEQGACHPLEVCSGGFSLSSYCRSGCVPFLGNQCSAGRWCVPESQEVGFCSAFGDTPEFGTCTGGQRCGDGMSCIDFGAGQPDCYTVCLAQAAQGSPGSCDEGRLCRQLTPEGVGICLSPCDMFDAAQGCPEGQGCTPLSGARPGYCAPRGDGAEGEPCTTTVACEGDLQCVPVEMGARACSRPCLPDAAVGEEGACLDGESCEPLPTGELGACREQ
ncbi:MAG: hypothetical protein CMH57_13695 [Myxococcales bacterium]|nr:hypothetical protein [Myxococcales bacterium]